MFIQNYALWRRGTSTDLVGILVQNQELLQWRMFVDNNVLVDAQGTAVEQENVPVQLWWLLCRAQFSGLFNRTSYALCGNY